MEKIKLELTEMQRLAILSGIDLLEQMLCDDNPHKKENELGIANTRATCNEIREKFSFN